MNQLCFSTTGARRADPALFLNETLAAMPAGVTLIPNSPITRMLDAAQRGDLQALQFEVVAMRGPILQLTTASDDVTPEGLLDALVELGIVTGRVAADISQYIALARAGIRLTNAVLGFSNVFANSDREKTVAVLRGEAGIATLVEIDLTAKLRKENKGFAILDNVEEIREALVGVEVRQGPPVSQLDLIVTLTAFGIGQDEMTAPLKVINGSGDGPPDPVATTNEVDLLGSTIVQRSIFVRTGTEGLSISLEPAPGQIDYGLNGANVGLLLEVEGVATYPFGRVVLQPARALELGLSI